MGEANTATGKPKPPSKALTEDMRLRQARSLELQAKLHQELLQREGRPGSSTDKPDEDTGRKVTTVALTLASRVRSTSEPVVTTVAQLDKPAVSPTPAEPDHRVSLTPDPDQDSYSGTESGDNWYKGGKHPSSDPGVGPAIKPKAKKRRGRSPTVTRPLQTVDKEDL